MSKPDIKKMMDQKDIAGLIKALKDKDLETSSQAAFALRVLGPDAKDALPALKEVLTSIQSQREKVAHPSNAKELSHGMTLADMYKDIQDAITQIQV